MSKRQIIMLLGVIIILIPFSGLTSSWKLIANTIAGLAVILIAYKLYFWVDKTDSETDKDNSDHKSTDIRSPNKDLPFVDHHSDVVNRN